MSGVCSYTLFFFFSYFCAITRSVPNHPSALKVVTSTLLHCALGKKNKTNKSHNFLKKRERKRKSPLSSQSAHSPCKNKIILELKTCPRYAHVRTGREQLDRTFHLFSWHQTKTRRNDLADWTPASACRLPRCTRGKHHLWRDAERWKISAKSHGAQNINGRDARTNLCVQT